MTARFLNHQQHHPNPKLLRSEELKHFNILPGELPRVLIAEKNFDFFIEDVPHFFSREKVFDSERWMPVFVKSVKRVNLTGNFFWHDTYKTDLNLYINIRSTNLLWYETQPRSTGHRAVACNIPARRFEEACRRRTLIATE